MLYAKDFEYFKPKALGKSYLQTFENRNEKNKKFLRLPRIQSASTAKESKNERNTLCSILKPYMREYCDTSSLHGFRYLTHPELKYYEK